MNQTSAKVLPIYLSPALELARLKSILTQNGLPSTPSELEPALKPFRQYFVNYATPQVMAD